MKISGEVGNLEGTIDDTNKMRDMSKKPNLSDNLIIPPGGAAPPTIG